MVTYCGNLARTNCHEPIHPARSATPFTAVLGTGNCSLRPMGVLALGGGTADGAGGAVGGVGGAAGGACAVGVGSCRVRAGTADGSLAGLAATTGDRLADDLQHMC